MKKSIYIGGKFISSKTIILLSLLIFSLCIGAIFIVTFAFPNKLGDPENRTKYAKFLVDMKTYDTDMELYDAYDYVFIARIDEDVKTKRYFGNGYEVPYTFYEIEDIAYLKGEKEQNNSRICFYGGMRTRKLQILCRHNDEVMYTGNYYLIFTYKKSATSKEKRIGKDDYIIFRNEQKILLDGYDENKLLTEQNQEILDIINRFK